MRRLMRLVVTDGFGKPAEVAGYYPGGKTGTAEKVGARHGGYKEHSNVAAFISVFPMNAPRYAVYMMLDEPHGEQEHLRLCDRRLGGRAGGRAGDRADRSDAGPAAGHRRMRRRSTQALYDPAAAGPAGRCAAHAAGRRPRSSPRRPAAVPAEPGLTVPADPHRRRRAPSSTIGATRRRFRGCRSAPRCCLRRLPRLRFADIMRQFADPADRRAVSAAWRQAGALDIAGITADSRARRAGLPVRRASRQRAPTAAASSPRPSRAAPPRCWPRRAPLGRLACRRVRCCRTPSRAGAWPSSPPCWPGLSRSRWSPSPAPTARPARWNFCARSGPRPGTRPPASARSA